MAPSPRTGLPPGGHLAARAPGSSGGQGSSAGPAAGTCWPFPRPLPPASTTVRGLTECLVCSAQPGTTLESPPHAQGAHGPLTPPVPGIESKTFRRPTLFPFGATHPLPRAFSFVSFEVLLRERGGQWGPPNGPRPGPEPGLQDRSHSEPQRVYGKAARPTTTTSLSLPLHRWAQAKQRALAGPLAPANSPPSLRSEASWNSPQAWLLWLSICLSIWEPGDLGVSTRPGGPPLLQLGSLPSPWGPPGSSASVALLPSRALPGTHLPAAKLWCLAGPVPEPTLPPAATSGSSARPHPTPTHPTPPHPKQKAGAGLHPPTWRLHFQEHVSSRVTQGCPAGGNHRVRALVTCQVHKGSQLPRMGG